MVHWSQQLVYQSCARCCDCAHEWSWLASSLGMLSRCMNWATVCRKSASPPLLGWLEATPAELPAELEAASVFSLSVGFAVVVLRSRAWCQLAMAFSNGNLSIWSASLLMIMIFCRVSELSLFLRADLTRLSKLKSRSASAVDRAIARPNLLS